MKTPLSEGVSFFTNCYEGDWKAVLQEGRLRHLIESCKYNFAFKGLIINNVKSRDEVEHYAKEAVRNKIIDAYFFSADFSHEILSAFSIKRESFILDFHDGYWYSMGPLAAVYLCTTEHLLYFTCDCIMEGNAASTWIDEGICHFSKNASILVANPLWNNYYQEANDESFQQDENWFYGHCFSDQCFLVRVDSLRGDIYGHYHEGSEIFPTYAGNLFERRVDSYMRQAGLIRMTHKSIYYIHDNEVSSGEQKKKAALPITKQIKHAAGNFKKHLRLRFGHLQKGQ